MKLTRMKLTMTSLSLASCRFVVHALITHVKRFALVYLMAVAVFAWCYSHFRIALNMTNSLPTTAFLIVLGDKPDKIGQYVAFKWERNQFYAPSWTFVKRIEGVAGQTVTVDKRAVFIDGRPVGYAKEMSGRGIPLVPIQPGVIPLGQVYAQTPHPDSLDSRYAITGLIASNRVIGRAYEIF
jgi:conjugal transfer pilin signal peptidase TrbI